MELNKNSIAVISGGGSGMGAAVARRFAALGVKVVILDLNAESAQNIAAEIGGLFIVCDVADPKSVESAFAEIEKQVGIPRICINCAGICPAKRIVDKAGHPMPLIDFSQVIDVNLYGTFNTLRVAAAMMSRSTPINQDGERGVIINTASIAAYEGQIGQIAYSASKGAVVSMTLPAARELSRYGIRVLTIAPGLVETPMLQGLPETVRMDLTSHVPFPKRLGNPQEYAMLVQHMVENSLLNGCVVRLDGALRMQ